MIKCRERESTWKGKLARSTAILPMKIIEIVDNDMIKTVASGYLVWSMIIFLCDNITPYGISVTTTMDRN